MEEILKGRKKILYMRIIKTIIALVNDILILIVFSLLFFVMVGNTLGGYSLHLLHERDAVQTLLNLLIVISVITVIYFLFAAFNKWRTIERIILFNRKLKNNHTSFFI